MLKQEFSERAISKVLNHRRIAEIGLPTQTEVFDWIKQEIKNRNGRLNGINSISVKQRQLYIPSDAVDRISIDVVDRFLRRIYSVKQSDRTIISQQIKRMLQDESIFHLYRFDIKSCFESISFAAILNRIDEDCILDPDFHETLRSLHDHCVNVGLTGIPRGFSVSSTLCELYLEALDSAIRSLEGVIFYARYVDDVVIFCDPRMSVDIEREVSTSLALLGLSLNESGDKNTSRLFDSGSFEFLGYRFEKISRKVKVGISDKKMRKIKTRIYLAFKAYSRDHNFSLLSQRINYLSTLKVVRHSKTGNVLGGLVEQYKIIDDLNDLKEIDRFYVSVIMEYSHLLGVAHSEALRKVSFWQRFKSRASGTFTRSKSALITEVWSHV